MLTNEKAKRIDYFGSTTFYLFSIIVLLAGQFLSGVVSFALVDKIPDIAQNGDFNAACMIFFQVLSAAFIFLYFKTKKTSPNFSLIRNEESGRGVGVATVLVPVAAAIVLMIGMYLPTVWYGYLTQVLGIPPEAGAVNVDTVSSVVMLVIASVFLAPVFEETIYRGVLLHGLRDEFSAVRAILLSALAFMLMHLNPLQTVYQFALGVLAAVIVLRTKRLLPSMILHASSNALALVVEFTPFADVITGCVNRLTLHVAAAVFITLGLLVGAGGVLFVLVRFALKEKKSDRAVEAKESAPQTELDARTENTENTREASTEPSGEQSVLDRLVVVGQDGSEQPVSISPQDRAEERKRLHKRDASVRFYIGIGICVFMFIINTVTLILL